MLRSGSTIKDSPQVGSLLFIATGSVDVDIRLDSCLSISTGSGPPGLSRLGVRYLIFRQKRLFNYQKYTLAG